MKPPVIVYNWGDVEVYRTVEEAERHLEAFDVSNGEYLLFDSEGRILEVVVGVREKVAIREVGPESRFVAQTKHMLLRLLTYSGMNQSALDKTPLAELVQKAMALTRNS